MATITLLTNGTNEIVLNTTATIANQHAEAKAAGFPAGKTSFFELVKGNRAEVKGYRLETREDKPVEKVEAVVKATRNTKVASAEVAKTILAELNVADVHVSTRKVFGTVKNDMARFRLVPCANGNVNVRLYETKASATLEEIAAQLEALGIEPTVKARYIKLNDMAVATVASLIA